jgi:prepilin signal peptidase PulO-like enzyme (type II secretory pathway)
VFAWDIAAASLALWALASFSLARSAETRAARKRPPLSWPAIAAASFVGVAALASRATPANAAACGLACIGLVVAADSDARTGYLFDAVTLPAALLVTAAVIAAGSTLEAACGVALIVGAFGAIVLFSNGRLMGLGDVKAMFALGAAFGPLESLVAIFAACISGIVAASLAGNLRPGARLSFGPHLAAGSAFALVAGDGIVHHWMGL